MAVEKLSISLDEHAVTAARRAAEAAGLSLSAWLSRAALREAHLEDGLAAVAEYEAEHGAFTPEELAEADRVLDELGIGKPVPADITRQNAAALARLDATGDAPTRRSA